MTVTDTAGNPAEVSIAFPTVDKGEQTLTGFAYSTDTVTFGDTAPTVIAPSGAQTALAYTATPSSVCTVDPGTGALTLAGVGACVVTVTAASNDNYDQATASFTVTVQDTLALSVDTIASDDTVNIAEKTAGFAISGTTGSEGGVAVSVTIGAQSPLTATSDSNGAWSVSVPADATYIAGTSVAVSVSASKTGFTAPGPVTRTLAVDLAAPSVSYTAPASLKVDVAITAMTPTTADTDIASYGATGLPSGLTIHAGTGAIGGTPDTAEANSASRHGDGDRHRRQPRRGLHRLPHGGQGRADPDRVRLQHRHGDLRRHRPHRHRPQRGADRPGVHGHAVLGVHGRPGDGRADARRGGRVRGHRDRRVKRQLRPGHGQLHRHRAGHPGAERRHHCQRRHRQHRREDGRLRDLGHHRLGGRRGGQRHHRRAVAADRDLRQQRRLVGQRAGRRHLHRRHQRGGVGVGLEDRLHRTGRCDAHPGGGPRRALGELHRAGVAQGGRGHHGDDPDHRRHRHRVLRRHRAALGSDHPRRHRRHRRHPGHGRGEQREPPR